MIAKHGVQVEQDDLAVPGGDIAFDGYGPEGMAMIGIERKTIHDLLHNMRNNHYVGVQLPRMATYYDIRYLLVEGIVRPNPYTGILEQRGRKDWFEVVINRSRYMWEDYEKYVTSLEWAPGFRVLRTSDTRHTAQVLVAKYHWYQKQWHEHHSLKGLFYKPFPQISLDLSTKEDYFRLVCASLPNIGPEKSLELSSRWRCLWDLCHAEPDELRIPNLIGDLISRDIYDFIRGQGKWKK